MKKLRNAMSWLAVTAVLTIVFIACSDEFVVDEQAGVLPIKTVYVTVGADIGSDGTTRSSIDYNSGVRTLKFTEGDRLFVRGDLATSTGSDIVAGYLNIDVSTISDEGTNASFSGELTGDFTHPDNPLGDCSNVTATLVHRDAGDAFEQNVEYKTGRYNKDILATDVATLMTSCLTVTGNYDNSTRSFSLNAVSEQPILNCTFTGLAPHAAYSVTYYFGESSYDQYSRHLYSTVTADDNGKVTFACFGQSPNDYYHVLCFINTAAQWEWELVNLGHKRLDNKVYNIIGETVTTNSSGGYYKNANNKSGAELKTALCHIIYNRNEGGSLKNAYKALWTHFQTTDKRANGSVWDMYSNKREMTFGDDQAGTYHVEGDVYNREHSFPNSWFGGEVMPMYTDLHHLYPTDGYVNGRRSNYPFGENNGEKYTSENGFSKLGKCTYPGYTGTVFEPNDEYKGDFARTYFYMVTCYEEKISDWYTNYSDSQPTLDGNAYPGLSSWQLEMLMKWAANDPVSVKEKARNEAIWKIQQNRNPFIDYPGLEQYIWGSRTTEVFQDFYLTKFVLKGLSN